MRPWSSSTSITAAPIFNWIDGRRDLEEIVLRSGYERSSKLRLVLLSLRGRLLRQLFNSDIVSRALTLQFPRSSELRANVSQLRQANVPTFSGGEGLRDDTARGNRSGIFLQGSRFWKVREQSRMESKFSRVHRQERSRTAHELNSIISEMLN